jgi:hypothetical protein
VHLACGSIEDVILMCTRPNAQIFRRNTIRILTWNVQGMKAGANQIAAALMRHNPDVITLQEYRTGQTSDQLASLLSEAGFGHPDHCTTCTGICSAVYGRDDIHSGVRPTGLGLAERYWVEATLNGIGISAVHIPPVGDRAGLRAPVWTAVLEHCVPRDNQDGRAATIRMREICRACAEGRA